MPYWHICCLLAGSETRLSQLAENRAKSCPCWRRSMSHPSAATSSRWGASHRHQTQNHAQTSSTQTHTMDSTGFEFESMELLDVRMGRWMAWWMLWGNWVLKVFILCRAGWLQSFIAQSAIIYHTRKNINQWLLSSSTAKEILDSDQICCFLQPRVCSFCKCFKRSPLSMSHGSCVPFARNTSGRARAEFRITSKPSKLGVVSSCAIVEFFLICSENFFTWDFISVCLIA